MEFDIKNHRCFQCQIELVRSVQMDFHLIVDCKYWAIATWQALYLLPSWYPLMHHLSTVFEENKLRCTQEGLFDEHSILIPLVVLLLRKRTCVYQAFLRNSPEVLCYRRNEPRLSVQQHWVVRGKSSLYLSEPFRFLLLWHWVLKFFDVFSNQGIEKSCLKGQGLWQKLLPVLNNPNYPHVHFCKQSCPPSLYPELLYITITKLAQQAPSCDNFITLYWLLGELKGI